MANEYLSEMELEDRIKDFTPAEQFLARQQYKISLKVESIEANCLVCAPNKGQRAFNVTGAAGFIGAVFAIVYELMKMRGGS